MDTDKIILGKRAVEVLELTVRDQRRWLEMRDRVIAETAKNLKDFDAIGWYQFEHVSFEDIIFMTDLKRSELDKYKPSELQFVVDEIKRKNPHFFAFRKRAGLLHTEE